MENKKILLGVTPIIERLSEHDLQFFCKIIGEHSGISIKHNKIDMMEARLRSRLQAYGLTSYREYRKHLEALANNDPEWEAFTNQLTTNKTDFFREAMHFEYLVKDILPAWLKTGNKIFKVWSSASSTGEEAYSLSMLLDRHLPKDRDYEILATDIDTKVIRTGKNAVYSVNKKLEIPFEYHLSCLDIGKRDAEGWFRLKKHLKEKVVFKQHNLIDSSTIGNNVFDLVLCRNVLIYFPPDRIDFVQKKIYTTVKPGGYFIIGLSESFQGLSHRWKNVGPSVFKKEL